MSSDVTDEIVDVTPASKLNDSPVNGISHDDFDNNVMFFQ